MTEKTMVHSQSSDNCCDNNRTGERGERCVGRHAQTDRAALMLTLQSCSKRVVTTAAVDVEEMTMMAKILMASATVREGGQRPSMVDVG
jgi:hypothetical protein